VFEPACVGSVAPGRSVGHDPGMLARPPTVVPPSRHPATGIQSVLRDLVCVEFFCGIGVVWGAFFADGLAACGFDVNRLRGVTDVAGPGSEDITTEAGFLNAVALVLRIQVGGLATFAPMCGSYNWLCSSLARRAEANGFLGDEAAPPFVVTGNAAAKATAFLARVAALRGVQALVENPPKSIIWRMFRHHGVLLDLPYSCSTVRCGFRPSGSTEDEITKAYRFACTHPWVVSLSRQCACPPSVAHVPMTRTLDGKSWGRPAVMKRSQEYPPLLGTAIMAAWVLSSAPLESSPAPERPRAARLRPPSAGRISRPTKVLPKTRFRMGRPRASLRSGRMTPRKQRLSEGGRSGSSEAAVLGDSGSEPDLFGGGSASAEVSDGRVPVSAGDDFEPDLFTV